MTIKDIDNNKKNQYNDPLLTINKTHKKTYVHKNLKIIIKAINYFLQK